MSCFIGSVRQVYEVNGYRKDCSAAGRHIARKGEGLDALHPLPFTLPCQRVLVVVRAPAFFTYFSSQLMISATTWKFDLARRVAVRLVRERHVAHRRAVALERHVEPLGLDREGARVVVRLAVDQEDRLVDLVGVEERRHLAVDLGNLPERARLAWKPNGVSVRL